MFTCHPEQYKVKVIGIDPGTETLGVCIMDIDLNTGIILGTRANTFVGSKLPFYDKQIATYVSPKTARLKAHEENLYSLFTFERPLIVASEFPFFNPRMPHAYGPLVETINTINVALSRYDSCNKLYGIDPSSVKNAVGAKGNAKKEVMAEQLLTLENILLSDSPLRELDEHSVDAVAVAYSAYKNLVLPTIRSF